MYRSAVSMIVAAMCCGLGAPEIIAAPGDRSPDGVWVEVDRAALGEVRDPLPKEFRAYRLDLSALTNILATAPPESTGSGAPPDPVQMFIPLPDGTFAPVAVKQSPVVGRELELQYPGITTFAFNGTQDGAISGRATLTGTSFQAILRPPSDFARVTPLTTSTGTFYLSFLHRDRTDGADDFRHRHDHPREPVPVPAATHAQSHDPESHSGSPLFEVLGLQVGGTLRQFRLAAAATGEYYQAMAGPNGATDVFNAIVAEVNNANMVFEAEFSIRMVLTVAILYLDPSNDPYSTVAFDEACTTRQENVAAINNVIDAADYDIGFAFNQGTGFGCAWYVVCLADKARGAGLINTALTPGSSTGLLAHEMAHQLGARHTFSTNTGSCGNPGEFNQPSAFEPGSGSTISSYLGACAPNNVDTDVSTGAVPAGFYYHARTFEEIISNITSGSGTCGSSSAVGNSAPAVNAGADYTIPQGTPFTLTGSASDPDGDALTYTWEQYDVAANPRPINTDTGEGPLFRSVPPGPDASRTFPNLADILSNTVRNGEFLPTTNRTMTFRLTARDNRSGGGGVASDDAVLTVAGSPFFITSPNGGENFAAGCAMPVTWTIGGGSVATQIDLGFSNNGGTSFAPLLGATANDGAASLLAPCTATGMARVKASGVGNVFFDVSNNNFSIATEPPTVAVQATGGAVDDQCEFVVQFKAAVEDDCGVSASDVDVQAIKQTNNFDLGPVQFNAMQTDATHVAVTGSVLVSNLSGSPAILELEATGKDNCGLTTSDEIEVQVVDDTPPAINVTLDPTLLWPPNHRLTNVHASVAVTDNCPGASFVLTSVTSNEPDNGQGDGNTTGDIQDADFGTPDVDVSLRAERSGGGMGRIYTFTFTATDASQNDATSMPVVVVPHSKK